MSTCANPNQVHVATTPTLGVQVYEDCAVLDISAATALEIVLTDPGGTPQTLTAAFTTDGTDGKLEVTLDPSVLDEAGQWKMQGVVTLPDSTTPWKTEVVRFTVWPNL